MFSREWGQPEWRRLRWNDFRGFYNRKVGGDGRRAKRRELGLGSVRDVGLKDARAKASGYRDGLAKGVDPWVEKEKSRRASEGLVTFRQVADAYQTAFAPRLKTHHFAVWKCQPILAHVVGRMEGAYRRGPG